MGQLLINVSVDQESERLSLKQSQSTTPQLLHCPMPNRQALYSKLSTLPKHTQYLPTVFIAFLVGVRDRIADRSNLRKEGLLLAFSLRESTNPGRKVMATAS